MARVPDQKWCPFISIGTADLAHMPKKVSGFQLSSTIRDTLKMLIAHAVHVGLADVGLKAVPCASLHMAA